MLSLRSFKMWTRTFIVLNIFNLLVGVVLLFLVMYYVVYLLDHWFPFVGDKYTDKKYLYALLFMPISVMFVLALFNISVSVMRLNMYQTNVSEISTKRRYFWVVPVAVAIIVISSCLVTIFYTLRKDKLYSSSEEGLLLAIKSYPRGNQKYKSSLDRLQIAWQCCGLNDYQEFPELNGGVAFSCCKSSFMGPCTKPISPKSIHSLGCLSYFLKYFDSMVMYHIVLSWFVSTYHILILVISICLQAALNRHKIVFKSIPLVEGENIELLDMK